jgi:hypothetical protein
MKHYHGSMYDAFVWKWSKNVICDDAIFVTSCINDVIGNEIWWPTTQEQVVLGTWTYGISRLHWAHWWHIHQDSQTLEWLGPQGLVQWAPKIFTQWITVWLLIIEVCSFTYTLGIQVPTMMLPSCISLNYTKISINFFT